MDPLSHAALGRTLLGWADGAAPRAVAAASILGALSPDVDAVIMPFGWDRYLRVHELGTHSLAGALVIGLVTAGVIRRFTRTAWPPLAYAATAGAVSHIVLDLVSSARLRILWPLSDRAFSLPFVAMADPWLAAILLGAAVGLLVRPAAARRIAGAGLIAAAVFLALKAVLAVRAQGAYETHRGDEIVQARMMGSRWASLTEWQIVDRTADRVRVWQAGAISGRASLILWWPAGPQTRLVPASQQLESVRNFLAAHPFGFAVTIPRPEGGSRVLWSDVRYCWRTAGIGRSAIEPIVSGPSGHIACAFWFGGEFDERGLPVRELIRVFGFTQTRIHR